MSRRCLKNSFYVLSTFLLVSHGTELAKEEVDKVIEDEITDKLSTDLLQSIERKFQVDLERSVDMVLMKIKLLLQNGTHHIHDKLVEIQGMLEIMKQSHENKVDECILKKEKKTSSLAEKALHQMVICGYALIGQDPARAINSVIKLKNMIKQRMKPSTQSGNADITQPRVKFQIYEQKLEINGLLKVCGHQHDALRKVVQCIISKSPLIKSVVMEITGKLLEGVVELTKLMAHGAMHEACLIEVLKSVEDEAVELIKEVRHCVYDNNTYIEDLNIYIADNNATVLDINNKRKKLTETDANTSSRKETNMPDFLRQILVQENANDLDKKFTDNLVKLDIDMTGINTDINPNSKHQK